MCLLISRTCNLFCQSLFHFCIPIFTDFVLFWKRYINAPKKQNDMWSRRLFFQSGYCAYINQWYCKLYRDTCHSNADGGNAQCRYARRPRPSLQNVGARNIITETLCSFFFSLTFYKPTYTLKKKKKNFIKPQYNNSINTQLCGRSPQKTNVHHAGHLNKKHTQKKR